MHKVRIDLRHTTAILGQIKRESRDARQRLNDRLDQQTAKALGLRGNGTQAQRQE